MDCDTDAQVRTSPERTRWRGCCGARIRPVSQTGMIEAVARDRQYSAQEKFTIGVRNFRIRRAGQWAGDFPVLRHTCTSWSRLMRTVSPVRAIRARGVDAVRRFSIIRVARSFDTRSV